MRILKLVPFKASSINHIINMSLGIIYLLITTIFFSWVEYSKFSMVVTYIFLLSQLINFGNNIKISTLVKQGNFASAFAVYKNHRILLIRLFLTIIIIITTNEYLNIIKFDIIILATIGVAPLLSSSNKNSTYLLAGLGKYKNIVFINSSKIFIAIFIAIISVKYASIGILILSLLLCEIFIFIAHKITLSRILKLNEISDNYKIELPKSTNFISALTSILFEYTYKVDYVIVYLICPPAISGFYAFISNAYESIIGIIISNRSQTLNNKNIFEKTTKTYYLVFNLFLFFSFIMTILYFEFTNVKFTHIYAVVFLIFISTNIIIEPTINGFAFLQIAQVRHHFHLLLAPLLINIIITSAFTAYFGLIGTAFGILITNTIQRLIYSKKKSKVSYNDLLT